MRITMLSIGSIGDIRPYISLGRELAERGHSITIAAFPQYHDFVTEKGFRFHALSGDAEKMINGIMQPDTNGISYLPRLMNSLKEVIPDLIRSLSDSCRGADAMICNFFGSVYYSISEMYHIPCIQINFFPVDPTGDTPISSVRSQRMGKLANLSSYRIGYVLLGLVENRYLSEWRKDEHLTSRKVRTVPDYAIGDNRVPVIYAISPSLLSRPPEWKDNIYMSGFLFDDADMNWTADDDIVSFLSEGPAPVYIGFGSMNTGDMNRMITVILRAVRSAGVRAVISTYNTSRKFKSSSRVFFIDRYVPHEWLFQRVSAVIHHGGAGTTSAGLRFGKPTLVIPFAGDQPFWGNLVWQNGCGPRPLPRNRLSVQKLTKAVIDLVSRRRYADNARKMAEKMNEENGIKAASDIIEKEITSWK